MAFAQVWVAIVVMAYFAFRQWLQYKKRELVHKERLMALEKGIELPGDNEPSKQVTFQRNMLLMGVVWIALGIGAFIFLKALMWSPQSPLGRGLPPGVEWSGLVFILLGAAHLVVFQIIEKKQIR